MSPSRVVFVSDSGSQHVDRHLAAVRDAGCEVTRFVAASDAAATSRRRLPGRSLLAPIAGLRTLARQLAAIDADICHVQFAQGLQAWTTSIAARQPLVVSVWGGDVLFEQQDDVRPSVRRLTAALLESADLVTVESAYMERALAGLGISPRRTLTTCWGIDLDRFRPLDRRQARARLGLPPDAPVIYSPRIAQPFYNIDVIVRALPIVRERCPDARLLLGTFLADPDYLLRLRTLAADLGVADAVQVLDPLPEDELPLCYAAAEISVSVPRSDGVPRSVLEAMACGSVNVVGDLEPYRSYVCDGETARVSPIEHESLARTCVELLTAPALRRAIGDRAAARIREIGDSRREARRIIDAYTEIRRDGRRAPGPVRRAAIRAQLVGYLYGR